MLQPAGDHLVAMWQMPATPPVWEVGTRKAGSGVTSRVRHTRTCCLGAIIISSTRQSRRLRAPEVDGPGSGRLSSDP